MTDRYNQPDDGVTNWSDPVNENFADLGVEVADEVATWDDLPTATGKTSSNGNPKVYRVAADDVFVADGGSSWNIVGGNGSDAHPLPSIHTAELNTTQYISSDVTDVGGAIMSAISELSPVGGKIILPSGVLPQSTPVDLSAGVNGQEQTTPITIEGQGSDGKQSGTPDSGTVLDASSMSDHPIKITNKRESFTIRDLSIVGGDATKHGIHTGSTGYRRNAEISNVTVGGSLAYGFHLVNLYGSTCSNTYAQGTAQGFLIDNCNASNFETLKARNCTDETSTAVEVLNQLNVHIENAYIEGNSGQGLLVTGEAANLDTLYFEANNGGTTNTVVAEIGGRNQVVTGSYFAGSGGGIDELLINSRNSVFKSNDQVGGGMSTTSSSTYRNTFISNKTANIDFSAVGTTANTWIETRVFDNTTNTKGSGATVVSGQ